MPAPLICPASSLKVTCHKPNHSTSVNSQVGKAALPQPLRKGSAFPETQIEIEAMPQARGTASKTKDCAPGKPEAFRKGCGKAAANCPQQFLFITFTWLFTLSRFRFTITEN